MAVPQSEDDPIVIVGMGCRLPGDVRNTSDLWKLLETRSSAQSDVPANRFSIDNWYHADAQRKGGIVSRGGYFLGHDDSFRDFEPSFFGISPLEAASIDPQQRKLLEVVYETFESAGVTLEQVAGSQTACYVGAFTADFNKILIRDDVEQYFPYQSTGTDMTILSNRINYVFDLKGPSLTVDTACSSSLYALHLACQGLLLKDFEAAIVAGTNIIMDISHQLVATKLGILSPTSTCHSFDESADGFGRAEGITALYVKRLSSALAAGDPIRAVIRGSAINTNGRGLGINHPSAQGQEDVIRRAYSKAGLDLNETTYVECHGTGTPVGDPIEVSAIANAFAPGRQPSEPLLLSALKSQIGHTEGASGIAAVQKVVLSLEKKIVPATIGISRVNPALDLRKGRLRIVNEALKWPQYASCHRASINSFGYGGANAHLIVESAESYLAHRQLPPTQHICLSDIDDHEQSCEKAEVLYDASKKDLLIVSSAKSSMSLEQNLRKIQKVFLRCSPRDLAYTNATKRTLHQHRAFILASNRSARDELSLEKWLVGTTKRSAPVVALIFTGQGAQWPRMAVQLIETFSVARQTFDLLQACLDSIPERPAWALYDALCQPASTSQMMNEVTWTVTLCTAVQIVIVDLLKSWSINPVAVAGHSSGEAAAAYCAGHLTIKEAIITSYYRALAMHRTPTKGAMMAVGLGAQRAQQYFRPTQTLYLACRNSPQSVTISGDEKSIDELEATLKGDGVFARKVKSSGFANHSPLVEGAATYFRHNFAHSLPEQTEMAKRVSKSNMYSCISGDKVESKDLGVEYWAANISAPVLFDEACQRMLTVEQEVNLVIEIGPHSALAGTMRQIKKFLGINDEDLLYMPSLIRGSDAVEDMLRLAGSLFLNGYPIDLDAVNHPRGRTQDQPNPRHIVDLPTYQWNYDQKHWLEPRLGVKRRFRTHPRHDLLGSLEPTSTSTSLLWRNFIQVNDVPWVADHLIGTSVLFPASGYVAMAFEAVKQYATDIDHKLTKITIQHMSILRPMVLLGNEAVEVAFELHVNTGQKRGDQHLAFRLSSVTKENKWTEHCSGEVSYETRVQVIPQVEVGTIFESSYLSKNGVPSVYHDFSASGLNYRKSFRTLQKVQRLPGHAAEAVINLRPTLDRLVDESDYTIHPATLDGCLQAAFVASKSSSIKLVQRSYLPSEVILATVYLNDSSPTLGDTGLVISRAKPGGVRSFDASCQLHSSGGQLLYTTEVRFKAIEGVNMSQDEAAPPEPYQRLIWRPDIDHLTGKWDPQHFLALGSILEQVQPAGHSSACESSNKIMCLKRLVDLLCFKRPSMKIMELGDGNGNTLSVCMQATNSNGRFRSYQSFTCIRDTLKDVQELKGVLEDVPFSKLLQIDLNEDLEAQGFELPVCDLIILTLNETTDIRKLLKHCRSFLSLNGQLVIYQEAELLEINREHLRKTLVEAGIVGTSLETANGFAVLARLPDHGAITLDSMLQKSDRDVYIIYNHSSHFLKAIQIMASKGGFEVHCLHISKAGNLPKDAHAIVLAELEQPVLSNLEQTTLSYFQQLIRLTSSIIWVSSGTHPESSLMHGMAATVRAETPGLQLACVHIEELDNHVEQSLQVILKQQIMISNGLTVKESITLLRDGVPYISRYIIDESENFEDVLLSQGATELSEFLPGLCLDMRRIGRPETAFIKEKSTVANCILKEGFVKITPFMHSINRKNAMTWKALNNAGAFSHECFGRVSEVGEGSKLAEGDLIVCLTESAMDSEITTSEQLCAQCHNDKEGEQLLGLLEPTCIAWNTVVSMSRMNARETLFVHSSDLMVTLMVGKMAQKVGGRILMSHRSRQETEFLQDQLQVGSEAFVEFGETNPQIFSPSDGIDIVIDCEGDLDFKMMGARLAWGGRLIRVIASTEPLDFRLDAATASKGVTFSTLDLMAMSKHNPRLIGVALQEAQTFLRNSKTSHPDLEAYRFEDLSKAVDQAFSQTSCARIAIRWDAHTMVPVHRVQKKSLKFAQDGVYLLVGCLGGLGRSISTWMSQLGARNFIFLSRTGDDKPQASSLINDLRKVPGTSVVVIRGDVTSRQDVRAAIAAAYGRLRGIIQAAAAFGTHRFASMSINGWNSVMNAKVQGTTILHEETLGSQLDFFVMTSSSIGIIGAPTQGAYAAANAFLDGMARYRRQHGLPGVALSLGMVSGIGHVEEESIEGALLQWGAYTISEAEFLRMMGLACNPKSSCRPIKHSSQHQEVDNSLLVTGLDPTKVYGERQKSKSAIPPSLQNDWRFAHLVQAMSQLLPEDSGDSLNSRDLAENGDSSSSLRIQDSILQKMSSLIMVPIPKLLEGLHQPLIELGLDSMIGTEFQHWIWSEFKVQLDFMEIFAGGRSVASIVDLVENKA